MTQWLIEEAAFVLLDEVEIRALDSDQEANAAESLLLSRHQELVAMRDRMRAG